MAVSDESDWGDWDPWRATELYRRWYNATQRGRPNDFVICLTASSHTGVSGTGKTTVQTLLGQEFDTSPEGFDAETKATLDLRELAYDRLPDIENHSAVVADEIQGAPGTEGLDARRGMRQSSIDAINSILANRDKQLTVILGAQIMQMLDKRLFPMIDAWLLIRKEPGDPHGPLLTHHKMYTEDYNFSNPSYKTPALEDLTWPRIPHDDPDYRTLEQKKQKAKKRGSYDEDEETTDPLADRNELIKDLHSRGLKQSELADQFDLDQSQISRIIRGD